MIYFARSQKTGLVKIGFTSDFKRRIHHLNSLNNDRLTLVGLIEGDMQTEREMHTRFSDARVRGEWFKPCSAMAEFMQDDIAIPEGPTTRLVLNLPISLVRDIEDYAEQDQRKRADWIRITLGAVIRARKAKKARAA